MTGFSMSNFNSTCAEIFNTIREINKSLARQDIQQGLVPWVDEFTGEPTEEGLKNGLSLDTVVPHGDTHKSTDHDVADVFVDFAAQHGSVDACPSDPICLESSEAEPGAACNVMSSDVEETSDSILRSFGIRFDLKSDAVVTTIARALPGLQPLVSIHFSNHCSFFLNRNMSVVGKKGENCSNIQICASKCFLSSCLQPACENVKKSLPVYLTTTWNLFTSEFGFFCCKKVKFNYMESGKPPPLPPDITKYFITYKCISTDCEKFESASASAEIELALIDVTEMTTENILESKVDEAAESGDDDYDLDVHLHFDLNIDDVVDFTQPEEEIRSETSLGDLISSFSFCTLPVCENASVYLPSFSLAHETFNGNWCSIQVFYMAAVCPNPPWEPPEEPLKDFITWISRLHAENYLVSNKVEDMLHKTTDFGELFFTEDGSILAGCVCYFEVDSTKLDQSIIRIWPEEVRFKGFLKILFNREPTELPDIIVIEAGTEGTSPSNSNVQFGIVWINKTTCKFTLKVHKWAKASLLNDSESANIYLKQCGWQGHVREQGSASFCCTIGWYLTLQSSSIKWYGSLFHLDLNFLGSQFDVLMRCLSHSTSFITSGCCIVPLMLKVNCIGMVGQCLHIRGMVEFMLTLERSVKDGLVYGTHELQILCLPAHRKDSDFLPHTIFNWMMFLIAYWRTFISWIYTNINLELDKMGCTQVYGKELVVLYSVYIIIISLVGPTNDFMTDDIHFKQLQHTLCILEGSAEKSSYEWRWQMMSLRVNREVSGGNNPPHSDFNVAVGMARDGAAVTHHGVELELVVSSENNLCGAFSAGNVDHIETASGYGKMFSAVCPISITRARSMQPFPRFSMGIFVCIEVVQFFHLRSYVATPEPPTEAHDSVTFAKLQILAGLTYLETKKHELVANNVMQTGIEWGNNYSELIAPRDVAAYARLCARASFGWTELKNKGVNNSNFKNSLEFVTEARELVNDFLSNHYTSSLEYSGDNKSNLLVDIKQSDHVKTLYDQVHEEAVIQCVYHFMFVDMRMHANACRTIIGELKKEIEALITGNQAQARINSYNKVIFHRKFAWNLLASVFTWRRKFLMFSLPRPPEIANLEDKVDFKGVGMIRAGKVE